MPPWSFSAAPTLDLQSNIFGPNISRKTQILSLVQSNIWRNKFRIFKQVFQRLQKERFDCFAVAIYQVVAVAVAVAVQ